MRQASQRVRLEPPDGVSADHELLLGELSLERGAELLLPPDVQLFRHDFIDHYLVTHRFP